MHAERLGKYQLIERLALGGMADIYLARISGMGGFERHVVLKTLRTEGLADKGLIPMFLDEARLVATLHHQHIAQVYEIGQEAGTLFLAMEYVHGETIRKVLDTAATRGLVLPLAFGATVVDAAAAGLHHAHEQRGAAGTRLGIVHRDVTPSNVLVSYDGSTKLIDFGIAMAHARSAKTRSGFMKGKIGYMAPEQIRGYPIDRRSDVFALGILAYELLTQHRAFDGESQFLALERAVNGDVIAPSKVVPGFPPSLEEVILTALESDPEDRYATADEMRIALARVSAGLRLAIGESAIVKVLDALFGVRPEPWVKHNFARGSGEQTPIPSAVELEDMVTNRLALVEAPVVVVVDPTPAPPIPRPRTHLAMVVGAIGGAVALGLGIAIAVVTSAPSPPTAPAPLPAAMPPPAPIIAPAPVIASPPPPPPPPDQITLHVISDPPGATVVLDGVRLGSAPYTATLPLRHASGWLKVRRSDRIPVKIRVSLEHDVSWNVRLPPR